MKKSRYVIPDADRKRLAEDPWMITCKGLNEDMLVCTKKTQEWHHALMYAGKRIQRWYAIVPLCTDCHRGDNGTIPLRNRGWAELQAMERDFNALQREHPKFNWEQRKKHLTNIFNLL